MYLNSYTVRAETFRGVVKEHEVMSYRDAENLRDALGALPDTRRVLIERNRA